MLIATVPPLSAMPPPWPTAVLPLIVLLVTVSVPPLAMPPPSPLPLLPLIVLSVTVSVPPLLRSPDPPPFGVRFSLIVLPCTITAPPLVYSPALSPLFEPVFSLRRSVLLVRVSVPPLLKIPPPYTRPSPLSVTLALPCWIVRSPTFSVTSPFTLNTVTPPLGVPPGSHPAHPPSIASTPAPGPVL